MKTARFQFDLTDNLIMVFRLPDIVPADYCFSGGHPTNFLMVDWFRPENLPNEPLDIKSIMEFIRTKSYYRMDSNFLAICRTGQVFLVDAPGE